MLQYHGLRDIEPDHPIKDEVFDYDDVDDCGNPRVGTYSLPEDEDVDPVNGRIFESLSIDFRHCFAASLTLSLVEHIVDGQLIREFMEDAAAGR